MKANKILGIAALVLAVLVIATSFVGSGMRFSDGKLGELLQEASAHSAAIESHTTAAVKTAPSTVKKAAAALKAAETAVAGTQEALDNAALLDEAVGKGELDDETVALMLKSSEEILGSLDTVEEAVSGLESAKLTELTQKVREAGTALSDEAASQVLSLYDAQVKSAYKAVADAEDQLQTAYSAVADVYKGAELNDYVKVEVTATEESAIAAPAEAQSLIEGLKARSDELLTMAQDAVEQADEAQAAASAIHEQDALSFKDRVVLLLGKNRIGVMLTGVILLAIGVIALFFSEKFLRAWKRVPVFSTFISAMVMIIIQTYSLGFDFATYGEWGAFWLGNMLNVLRSNSSVGMIALGMTFVIITGGIDLAVGSTLSGIATVVMVVLDISNKGFFTGAGITGVPNYLLAIGAGLVTGVLLGTLTGLGITKGRIPPFIFTLGMMNVIRSVAQYFTKSYKPEVPKGFQVIANQELIGGQMLLPILYWLILAVIMYVIANHTAFGRHIYAVGSNERTSRLSGINVNSVKMKVYILMGLIVAIAAIVSVARLRGVDVASAGSGYEMNAIAAVIVGGTAMSGGRGSIVGTMLGVLIIGIMNNLLVLLHIDAFLSEAFTGAIIIFAVFLQRKERQ